MDDREEAQYVVRGRSCTGNHQQEHRKLGALRGLYRTNAQSRLFEEELLKYDVPYTVVGGVRFYDRAEIKDVMGYLRLLVNPDRRGRALRRIVNRAHPRHRQDHPAIAPRIRWPIERGVSLLEGLRLLGRDGVAERDPPSHQAAFLELTRRVCAARSPGARPRRRLCCPAMLRPARGYRQAAGRGRVGRMPRHVSRT